MTTEFQISAIEQATSAAVPPERFVALPQWPQWLLPMDFGTVGRAHSAVPLNHAAPDVACIAAIEAAYAANGLNAVWRLPEVPSFDAFRAALGKRGYALSQPTCVQTGLVADALGESNVAVDVQDHPVASWQQVYLGPGFDATDGASRIAILARGTNTHYAVVMRHGEPIASGALSLFTSNQGNWASIHGMRTAPQARRQGLASAVVREFARIASSQGFTNWFLQVEQGNTVAQAAYAKLGFATAWRYGYWRR